MLKKILLLSAIIYLTCASTCDNKKCPKLNKFYKELRCEPVIEPGKCCPTRYDCPFLKDVKNDKCYFNGVAYGAGDNLDFELTSSMCSAACLCQHHSGKANFNCAHIDCAEFFRPYRPECIRQYKLGSCCSSAEICDETEKNKLSTCEFEGKTYREGERMFPKSESCYECLCAKNFDNTNIINNPNCREVNCGVELRRLRDVQRGCIPVYYGAHNCCPIDWRCPNDDDNLIAGEGRSEAQTDPKNTCKFGKLSLNIGDSVSSTDKCRECKCILPPFAECTQKPGC